MDDNRTNKNVPWASPKGQHSSSRPPYQEVVARSRTPTSSANSLSDLDLSVVSPLTPATPSCSAPRHLRPPALPPATPLLLGPLCPRPYAPAEGLNQIFEPFA